MGFLDNVQSAVNRGTAAAQRTGRSTQLKSQLNQLMKQRRDFAAQLGASLYDAVKDNPSLRAGREQLLDGIAQIDQQRAAIEAEIAQIEAAAAAQQVANTTYRCPKCGVGVSGDDLFCSGCGLPIAEVKAAAGVGAAVASGPACPSCGAPMNEGDVFCMSCGAKLDAPAASAASPAQAAPAAGSAPSAGRACAKCGNALEPSDTFCGVCGTPVA